MSHWTTVKTKIKSLVHLGQAAKELGLVLHQGAGVVATGYNSNQRKCMAKIVGGATTKNWRYDIAIDKEADGTFSMTTDWYDGKKQIVGEDFKKLKQQYTLAASMDAIRKKGWTAQKRILKDGTIQLVASGM